MNTLGALLQKFLDSIASFWPFTVVSPWEQGVIVRFGRIRKHALPTNGIRGTGLHWVWPLIEQAYGQECNVEVMETEPQTVDKWTFTLGVQFQVRRLDLYYTRIHDTEKAIADVVRAAAAQVASNGAIDDCFGDKVRRLARKRMTGWGVELVRVAPITIAESPVLRLILDRSAPAAPTFNLTP